MDEGFVKNIVLVSAFAALVIVGAILSFPAPWNPVVPFTMATFFVILAGLMLGPWRGLAVAGLYLLLGAVGLPVFAQGSGGVQVFVGPTGGFLVGYGLAAFCAGFLARLWGDRIAGLGLAALVGSLAIYVTGLPWMHWRLMGLVDDWSWASTWGRYTAPFLVGDAVKALAAVAVARGLRGRMAALIDGAAA